MRLNLALHTIDDTSSKPSSIDVSLPLSFPTLSTPSRFLRHTRTISLLCIRSQTTSDTSTTLSSTSAPSSGSTLLRKCPHDESSEHDSWSTASTGPKVMCRGPSSPLAAHPSTPVTVTTPQRARPNLALNTTDATSTTEPSSAHPPEPASPVPTEITTDLPVVELTPEERRESLRAAGINVRDFAHESVVPNACEAPEVFDSCRRSSRCGLAHAQPAQELRPAHAQGALPPRQDRLAHARPGLAAL